MGSRLKYNNHFWQRKNIKEQKQTRKSCPIDWRERRLLSITQLNENACKSQFIIVIFSPEMFLIFLEQKKTVIETLLCLKDWIYFSHSNISSSLSYLERLGLQNTPWLQPSAFFLILEVYIYRGSMVRTFASSRSPGGKKKLSLFFKGFGTKWKNAHWC